KSHLFVCDELRYLTPNREVIREMGEPIIIEKGQQWILCYYENLIVGFICFKNDKILYAYTSKIFRGKGVFNLLYSELPNRKWTTIASNMSYPIFLKKGFKVVKNYKNCHKLILK